jgi:hypothetical protein
MALSRRAVLAGAAGMVANNGSSAERMAHIALIGDSVIDNKSYVEMLRMWPINLEHSCPKSGR